MRLGATRNLSAVQEDLHDPTGLARTVRALQPLLSTAVLRADRLRGHGRASRTALQRSDTLARSIYLAPMGAPATAQHVVLDEARRSRRALFVDTHHPCL